ncbi:MAG: GerAB/ArcD/ProY family transporter [Bacillota bacterium]
MTKVQISGGMFIAIVINLIYAKAIGLTQGSIAREVGSDMWLSTLLSIIQGVFVMWLTFKVMVRSPKHTIIQQSSFLLGKWGGKIVALLLFLFLTGAFVVVLATFVYHLNDYFLPDAPIFLFCLVAFIVGVFSAFHGLEVIARVALISGLFLFFLNMLIILGSLSYFDIRELMPVFDSGVERTAWASRYHNSDWAIATVIAGILYPSIAKKESTFHPGVMGILFAGFMVIMWPILEAGVLSPEVTGSYNISCMQMARSAEVGLFLHRYELIMIAFFAVSTFTQVSIIFLSASICTQQMFGMKDFRPVLIPVGLLLSLVGLWIVLDHSRAMIFIENYWVTLALSIAIPLPILLWILGKIFKGRLKQGAKGG